MAIPSVSFEGFPQEPIQDACEYIAQIFSGISGLQVEKIFFEQANPYLLISNKVTLPQAPTVLLYAHYDVQPPMDLLAWKTPPFEATEISGRLYGRGAADDKAGVILHYSALASILSTGPLPVNIKILLEGEEEIGSPHIQSFIEKYSQKLKADVIVIADATNHEVGSPSLTTSLRGLVSLDVTLKSMEQPLHSGMWGGPLPDPVQTLCKILSQLYTPEGEISVPYIRDHIPPLHPKVIESYQNLSYHPQEFQSHTQLLPSFPIPSSGLEVYTKIWRKPVLIITAIQAGQGKNTGNVLMNQAWARLGLRLPPGMDAVLCQSALLEKITELTPPGFSLHIESDTPSSGWETSVDHPYFGLACEALEEGFGKKTQIIGCGGSIPFVDTLSHALGGIPALLTGVEDPLTLAHSENESLGLADFESAVKSEILFLYKLAQYHEAH